MTKTEIYNSDYTKLNHSYIQIYETYKNLLEAEDADEEVMNILASILQVFYPTLDKIKSEMTVKTKFKEQKKQSEKINEDVPFEESNGSKIFHPKF